MVELEKGFETVHVVHDYWDGPRSGVADYGGRPHWFESVFDEQLDDYSDLYWLTPLSDYFLRLAQQQAAIFFRWRQAFDRGEVDLASHPALPADREDYKRLAHAINKEVAENFFKRFKVNGELKRLGVPSQRGMIGDFQVKWKREV